MHGSEPDHPAYRGFPSISYALTQRRRAAAGWKTLAGNHVFIESSDGVIIALCHLQRGSIAVRPGQHVTAGDLLAHCGNSGNSTEPHLHLQTIDDATIEKANAVSLSFNGELPRNGQIVNA